MSHPAMFGEVYYAEGEYLHELKVLNEVTKWRRRWQTGINGAYLSDPQPGARSSSGSMGSG